MSSSRDGEVETETVDPPAPVLGGDGRMTNRCHTLNGPNSPRPTAMRWSALVALPLLAMVILPTSAYAQQGVAVDVGRIELDETLQLGGTYTLPTIGVRNPGGEVTDYRIAVSDLETDLRPVPEEWVSFSPAALTLEPDERQRFEPGLTIPSDAAPGSYETLLAAAVAGEGEGARVGAAAATRLVFEVADEPVGSSDVGGVRGGGWLLALMIASLLVAMARPLRRIRIRVEPRS